MKASLRRHVESRSAAVEKTMAGLLRRKDQEPETIRKAMSYSLFAGGKRLRPVLVMAAAECCGLPGRKVLKTAAALEMIHTYSLIHDDLPAMDDDDLRRGKPTNHKVFGEAMAILAGDGLLTYAFEVAAENAAALGLPARAASELVRVIARGAGTRGMVGGQVADLEAEESLPRHRNLKDKALGRALEAIHLRKTAALIMASLDAGAVAAGGTQAQRAALRQYGRAIGLAFQIADDVLDVIGDKKKMGKKGSDAQNAKLTYASLYGVEKAQAQARSLIGLAHRRLRPFGARARMLHELADYIITRDK
ncbi:MAG: polyprenyl synthetase family protein [Elusimicrobiota bacterium]